MKKLTVKKNNPVNNNETKVVCPKCGAEFAIPAQEHIAVGIVIGKDSGLGVISPALAGCTDTQCTNRTPEVQLSQREDIGRRKKPLSASEKIKALKKAGVNTDNLFAMGADMIVRNDGANSVVPVLDDDPIFKAIKNGGYVANPTLYRRWVMSQVFHMMTYDHKRNANLAKGDGFTEALNAKGYKYMWKMLLEEFHAQAAMEHNGDVKSLQERQRWFNKALVISLCDDYMQQLVAYIDGLKEKHCKRVPYKRIGSRNIFCKDIDKAIITPLLTWVAGIAKATSAQSFYAQLSGFYTTVKNIYFRNTFTVPADFKDAYKGAGAYYTLKNLILFHGCSIKNGCIKLGQAKSLNYLEQKADEYQQEGWKLFGLLRKVLVDNNINVWKKIAEWRKK